MSYLPVDQETNNQAPQGGSSGAGQSGGAGSTAPPPQTGGSAGAASAATPAGSSNGSPTQFGSSASKLGDYLNANAPQIQGQAQNVATGLNNQYNQISGDIGNAANQFGQQVQGGYTQANSGLVDQAAANPTQFVQSNPNNVSGFQAQLNDQYTGPTSYEGSTPYSNIQNEVNSSVQNAGLLNSPTGLQNYLSQQGGGAGNATQASNKLDTLLYTGNPQANQTIQNAAGQFQNLTPQFQQSTQAQNAAIAQAQQQAQQAAAYAKGQINPVATNFGNTLNTGYQNAVNTQNQYNQGLSQFLGKATPLEQQINQWAGSIYGNPGISDFASGVISANQPSSTPITLAGYATPQQYQEAAALQQLIGSSYNSPLDQSNSAQAGTAPVTPGTAPTLQELFQDYGPAITGAYNKSFADTQNLPNAVATDTAQNQLRSSTNDLISYLESLGMDKSLFKAQQNQPGQIVGQGGSTGPLHVG